MAEVGLAVFCGVFIGVVVLLGLFFAIITFNDGGES